MTCKTLLIAAALCLAAGVASAQEASVTIRVGKLDPNNAADAKMLYRHISQAAAHVCGGWPSYAFGTEGDLFDRCFKPTLRDAVRRLDAPLVTTQYERGLLR